MTRNLWVYKNYIAKSAISDLKNRYAGSSIGVLWNILIPLFQILIFTFVFSQIMIAKIPGLDSTSSFAIYLCAGILPWGVFADSVIRGSQTFMENATYLKKLPVPEYIFMFQVIVSNTIITHTAMVLLFFVVVMMGGSISFLWLLVPLILILLQLFALGLAMVFGTLNVFFRDTGQFLNVITQLLMWLTPIVYVVEILPVTYQRWMAINPLYWYFEGLHDIIVFSKAPPLHAWFIMMGVSAGMLVVGSAVLNSLRTEIRDVI